MLSLTAEEKSIIEPLVKRYVRNRDVVDSIARVLFTTISDSKELRPFIHSLKYRTKDPLHLADKLARKRRDALEAGKKFNVTEENLFQTINDLAGLRILHLHTSQIEQIDIELQQCLKAAKFKKKEGPIAKTWDDEYRLFFKTLSIKTENSKNQYTSVHYVFDAQNDLKITAEIQVRTLAEELWGEVDHLLNYPESHSALECTEQIAVLARVTSSCTRLVDSIFRSDLAHRQRLKVRKGKVAAEV